MPEGWGSQNVTVTIMVLYPLAGRGRWSSPTSKAPDFCAAIKVTSGGHNVVQRPPDTCHTETRQQSWEKLRREMIPTVIYMFPVGLMICSTINRGCKVGWLAEILTSRLLCFLNQALVSFRAMKRVIQIADWRRATKAAGVCLRSMVACCSPVNNFIIPIEVLLKSRERGREKGRATSNSYSVSIQSDGVVDSNWILHKACIFHWFCS